MCLKDCLLKKAEMISDGEALEVYIEQQLVPSIGETAFGYIGPAEKNPDRCAKYRFTMGKSGKKSQGRVLDPIPLDQLLTKTGS